MTRVRSHRKIEKVRGMNASLSMSNGTGAAEPGPAPDEAATPATPGVSPRVGVIEGPALSERDPGRLHISRRQVALAVVVAALAAVAGVYTVNSATSGDQSYPAVVSTSKVYDLNFASTGTVAEIRVKPGQEVKAGQVLATQELGTLNAQLQADQQVVAADQAAVQQAASPTLTNAQVAQNGLQVQQQQTALANAQAALNATTNTGQANVAAAQRAVTAAESVAQGDYTLYAQACPNGPVAPDPSLTGAALTAAQNAFTHCQQLQSASESDQAAVAKAQAQVPVVQAQAEQADSSAQASVNAAQAALNLARSQGAVQGSPNAASQAQAKAALNQATAQLAQVQQQIQQATIVAPASGVVAQVNGSAGENLGPSGVPSYKAPASIGSGQPSGFTLFPSQPTPSSGSSSSGGTEPLIEVVGGSQQVAAQVPESNVGRFRVGNTVSVAFSVLDTTQQGVVTGVVLSPTGNSSAVTYEVIIRLTRTVPGLLPGMTATVRA